MTAETPEPKKRGRPKGKPQNPALTPKQTKFLAHYLATGNAVEAYKKAYNAKNMTSAAIATEAWKMTQHPLISQKALSHKNSLTEKAEISALDLVRELEEVQKLALADSQYTPWIAAQTLKAKLLGAIVNEMRIKGNVDHSHTHDHITRPVSEVDGLFGHFAGSGPQGGGKASLPN